MRIVPVKLKGRNYNIVIGRNILPRIGVFLKRLKIGQDAVIITNARIKKLHGKAIVAGLSRYGFSVKFFEVPDSEKSKSASVAFRLIEKIAEYDVKRRVFVVAFGGGVVGDLAGYVAAIYKRGIPYIQVPTTLLAQIDSAIGGKVAIDLKVGKNLVGAFYQPKIVLSDVSLLKTLSRRQIRNGLAEAVKYGVIQDKRLFSYLEKNCAKILVLNPKMIAEIVFRSSKIKAEVVRKDEKETKNIRTILNFGHTVGHAIEAAGGYDRYQHGEAVALGMRIASSIARQLGMFGEGDLKRLNDVLTRMALPEKIKGVHPGKILKLMAHDKKFKAGKNRFVLPAQIGRVKIVEGVSKELIEQAIEQYR